MTNKTKFGGVLVFLGKDNTVLFIDDETKSSIFKKFFDLKREESIFY